MDNQCAHFQLRSSKSDLRLEMHHGWPHNVLALGWHTFLVTLAFKLCLVFLKVIQTKTERTEKLSWKVLVEGCSQLSIALPALRKDHQQTVKLSTTIDFFTHATQQNTSNTHTKGRLYFPALTANPNRPFHLKNPPTFRCWNICYKIYAVKTHMASKHVCTDLAEGILRINSGFSFIIQVEQLKFRNSWSRIFYRTDAFPIVQSTLKNQTHNKLYSELLRGKVWKHTSGTCTNTVLIESCWYNIHLTLF